MRPAAARAPRGADGGRGMKRVLLGALHLIGAAIFVVVMIARAAQASDGQIVIVGPYDPLGSSCRVGAPNCSETCVILPTGSLRPA